MNVLRFKRDLALIAISALFVAGAIAMLIAGKDPRMAFGGLVFFGACLCVGVGSLRWKRRALTPGPRPPLPPMLQVRPAVGLLLGIATVCGVMAWSFWPDHQLAFWTSAGAAAFCAGATVALACGWRRAPDLHFTRAGLTLAAPSSSYTVPWDEITDVALGSFHDNPVVYLAVASPERLARAIAGDGAEPRAVARAVRSLTWIRHIYDADQVLFPHLYRVDPVALTETIGGYASAPERRAQLPDA
jgi:hypothetical protein